MVNEGSLCLRFDVLVVGLFYKKMQSNLSKSEAQRNRSRCRKIQSYSIYLSIKTISDSMSNLRKKNFLRTVLVFIVAVLLDEVAGVIAVVVLLNELAGVIAVVEIVELVLFVDCSV